MKISYNNNQIEQLLLSYLLGELDSNKKKEVEDLISQDIRFKNTYNELNSTISEISYSIDDYNYSSKIKENLFEEINTELEKKHIPANYGLLNLSSIKLPLFASTIIILFLSNIFFFRNYTIIKNELSEINSTSFENELNMYGFINNPFLKTLNFDTKDLDSKFGGKIIYDERNRKAILDLKNLPQTKTGNIYVFWCISEDDEIQYMSKFNIENENEKIILINSLPTLENIKYFLITEEKGDQLDKPTGDEILSMEL